VGIQWVQAHPQKFWFAENLGKIPENPVKNGVQSCLVSNIGAQGLQKNTWRPFLEVTPKKVLNDLCGRKLVGESCTKTFPGKLGGNSGKNPSHPKACPYTKDEKSPPPPLPLFWKEQGGNASAIPPSSGATVLRAGPD